MAALDTTACLRSLCGAYQQFRNHSTEQAAKGLEREIDVLIGITTHGGMLKGFSPKQLLHAECLSVLVSILNETSPRPSMWLKAMVLLFHLAGDCETRKSLHDTFKLTSTLSNFLIRLAASNNDQLILQCIQLLQRITYNCRIQAPLGYVEELVRYLITKILASESNLTMPCLGLLANLCRHNVAVKAHIKAMDNIKATYRALITFLSHSSWTIVIYGLSVLTSLSLNEPLGEKVFNAKNIDQTFQLIFNILLNGGSTLTRRYAVDLFIDLLECAKLQQYLSNYGHLRAYLKEVMNLLKTSENETRQKILELLVSISRVSDLRKHLTYVLMMDNKSQDRNVAEETSCFVTFLQLAPRGKDEAGILSTIYVMDVLKEIYEEILLNGYQQQFDLQIGVLLPILSEHIMEPTEIESVHLKRRANSISKAMEILIVLSEEESLKDKIADFLDFQKLSSLVLCFYQKYSADLKSSRTPAIDCRIEISSAVIRLLELMTIIRSQVMEGKISEYVLGHVLNLQSEEEIFASVLQDQQLSPFIAFGLCSQSSDLIHSCLNLIQEGNNLGNFQMQLLSNTIASSNISRDAEVTALRLKDTEENGFPIPTNFLRDSNHVTYSNSVNQTKGSSRFSSHDATIATLADRMRSGLEIKDSKFSEIMDIYEHKLVAHETKESHLQDLLEAKALALSQADRLLAQYRCRRAQSEAECLKLRSLLQETQRICEQQTEKARSLGEDKRQLSEQIENLAEENRSLKKIADEHEQLKTAYQEQSQRLETVQRSLAAATEEHKSLSELNDMLRKHGDNLKIQHECAIQQLRELEEEKQKILQQLKAKDTKLNECQKTINQMEKESKQREKEHKELQKTLDTKQKELKEVEKLKTELSHKVSSLEVICRQHEKELHEKDNAIQEIQTELNKQSQIAAMIHNLTSGKIPLNNVRMKDD